MGLRVVARHAIGCAILHSDTDIPFKKTMEIAGRGGGPEHIYILYGIDI